MCHNYTIRKWAVCFAHSFWSFMIYAIKYRATFYSGLIAAKDFWHQMFTSSEVYVCCCTEELRFAKECDRCLLETAQWHACSWRSEESIIIIKAEGKTKAMIRVLSKTSFILALVWDSTEVCLRDLGWRTLKSLVSVKSMQLERKEANPFDARLFRTT